MSGEGSGEGVFGGPGDLLVRLQRVPATATCGGSSAGVQSAGSQSAEDQSGPEGVSLEVPLWLPLKLDLPTREGLTPLLWLLSARG